MRRTPELDDQLRDEAAFVHRLARALLRDPELAADVAQDTLVAACATPPRTTDRAGLRAFLRTIARRLAHAALRRRAEREQKERLVAKPEASDAEARAQQSLAVHRELVAAVESLPEPYRTTVVLRFVRDLPPRAIARECEVTSEVVRQRLHRGLAMLRERLDRRPGGRSAWTAAIVAAGLSPLPHVALVGALMTKKLLGVAAFLLVAVGAWMTTPSSSDAAATESADGIAGAVASAVRDDEPSRVVAAAPGEAVARASAILLVHVRDEHGRPVPGAKVYDCRADAPPFAIECDGNGNANLSRETQARELVVRSPNHLSAWTRVAAEATESTVRLSSGTELDGVALVDGVAAPEGLELSLLLEPADDPHRTQRSEHATRLLAEDEARTVRVRSGGGFTFAGLPIDWHGTLVVPNTHWILGARNEPGPVPRALDLAASSAVLTVRTTQLPLLRGRVLYDDGSTAGGAKVVAQAAFDDQTHAETSHAVADSEGRFELPLAPQWIQHRAKFADPTRRPALVRATFLVGAQDTQRTSVEWAAPIDQGDAASHAIELRITRLPTVHFAVVGERSRPLAGARMLTDHLSQPTDDLGRGVAHGTPLGVAAPDHLVAAAETALRGKGTIDDPLVFALQESRMVIRVRTPDGSPLRGCSVEARYAKESLPLPPELSALYSVAFRMHGQPHRHDDRSWQLNLALDGEATAHAPGLAGGSRCTVTVRDSVGTVLGEFEVAPPPMSTDPVDVVVLEPTAELRGRVLAAGGPPRRSTLTIRAVADDGWAHRKPVNADGSFAIACLRSRTPWEVLVEAEDFAPLRVVATAGAFLDVELQKGRSVEVAVLDPDGRAVAVRDLAAVEMRDTQLRPQELAAGRLRFDDLPREPITFRCHLGGRAFEVVAVADATTATLRLPALASLRIVGANANEGVEAQCLDPHGEPFRAFPRDEVCPLPPGRYRFENATPAELVLRAGETAEIALH